MIKVGDEIESLHGNGFGYVIPDPLIGKYPANDEVFAIWWLAVNNWYYIDIQYIKPTGRNIPMNLIMLVNDELSFI